jgi:hypothetical protein
MYEIQIEMQDKWYNLADFDSYEEIEALGEILSVDGLPDGLDLESDFDALKAYDGMDEVTQKIIMAYYKATDVFNPDDAMEAYAGTFADGAEFADYLAYEFVPELKDLPDWIALHIDWQAVWDAELHYEYFEWDDYYFRNL